MLLFFMTIASVVSIMFYPNDNIAFGYLFLPFFILFVYTIYRLLKKCCACVAQRRATHQPSVQAKPLSEHKPATAVANDEYIEDDLYADRILNPDGYKNNN